MKNLFVDEGMVEFLLLLFFLSYLTKREKKNIIGKVIRKPRYEKEVVPFVQLINGTLVVKSDSREEIEHLINQELDKR